MTSHATDEPVSFQSGPFRLEGVLHRPGQAATGAGVVVCHPHPLRGGDMNSHVVVGVCRALAERGVTALRFNFRGTGRIEGTYDEGRGEREDVVAALDALVSQAGVDAGRIGLAGYSFGSSMALRTAGDPRVRALALISLPARAAVDPPADTPTLIITGEHDSIAPPDALRSFAATLPAGSRLEVVPGVDHFWWEGLSGMVSEVTAFLERHLAQESPEAPAP
jgi:alpha/beta superfamily hydrolase